MATGWQELFEHLRAASGVNVDSPHWARDQASFAQLLGRSPHFFAGSTVLKLIESQPHPWAWAWMAVIAGLLAPIEWPLEWEARRPELLRALTDLARQTRLSDPKAHAAREPATLFSQVDLGPDKAAVELSHRILSSAVTLLGTPCRRDQVTPVADLCNAGTAALRATYQRILAQQEEGAMREPLLDPHLRYRVAVLRYDDAALAMNDAIGAVLFQPFGVAGPSLPASAES